ncbi:hypothetical protein R0131_09395 [Clostridium sp. AL.422]|uniref:hypothetical protein n=1 Tax=Clostridium TaxID=1485 RepID=UPI00293DEEBD|nr:MULTISPECIES: hypothetical protein [unclassified Clostridium]MDV4151052.1 hypothetical protein [Clostridium sp. AL.422]
MRKTNFLKPILIHIVVLILSFIIVNIIWMIGELLTDNFIRSVVNASGSLIVAFLYIFLCRKFLKDLSRKTIWISIGIILSINLIFALCGFLMMNSGSQNVVEGSQVPLLFLIIFNYGFLPLIHLLQLPNVLGYMLMSLLSPSLLYLGTINFKSKE